MKNLRNVNKKLVQDVMKRFISNNRFPVFIIFLIISIFWLVLSPSLRSISVILDLLREISPNIITAIGVGILMIGGEFDLSVGSLLAFVGVFTIEFSNITGNIFIGITIGLLCGLIVGALNSLLVNWLRLNSLIATLAMMYVVRGIVYVYTKKVAIIANNLPKGFLALYYGSVARIPIPFILAIVLLIVFNFIYFKL